LEAQWTTNPIVAALTCEKEKKSIGKKYEEHSVKRKKAG